MSQFAKLSIDPSTTLPLGVIEDTEDGEGICTMDDQGEEGRRYATLFAAAPEMKSELQTADDLLAELSQYVSKDHEALIVEQRRRINDLLAKAEGRA